LLVIAVPGAARHSGLSVSRSVPDRGRPRTFLSIGGVLLSPVRRIPARKPMRLMLITIAMGMCLMNGCSVVKEQSLLPWEAGNRRGL
jgi:hypothetical protein